MPPAGHFLVAGQESTRRSRLREGPRPFAFNKMLRSGPSPLRTSLFCAPLQLRQCTHPSLPRGGHPRVVSLALRAIHLQVAAVRLTKEGTQVRKTDLVRISGAVPAIPPSGYFPPGGKLLASIVHLFHKSQFEAQYHVTERYPLVLQILPESVTKLSAATRRQIHSA